MCEPALPSSRPPQLHVVSHTVHWRPPQLRELQAQACLVLLQADMALRSRTACRFCALRCTRDRHDVPLGVL